MLIWFDVFSADQKVKMSLKVVDIWYVDVWGGLV